MATWTTRDAPHVVSDGKLVTEGTVTVAAAGIA
jgi:hypothetical protein